VKSKYKPEVLQQGAEALLDGVDPGSVIVAGATGINDDISHHGEHDNAVVGSLDHLKAAAKFGHASSHSAVAGL